MVGPIIQITVLRERTLCRIIIYSASVKSTVQYLTVVLFKMTSQSGADLVIINT